jgi:hypothetical protein
MTFAELSLFPLASVRRSIFAFCFFCFFYSISHTQGRRRWTSRRFPSRAASFQIRRFEFNNALNIERFFFVVFFFFFFFLRRE